MAKKIRTVWHIYILETLTGQLYTGMTKDLVRRMKEHQKGKSCRFTRTFGFKKLLYTEDFPTRSKAMQRECQIKTFPRQKKLKLITAK